MIRSAKRKEDVIMYTKTAGIAAALTNGHWL